MAAALATAASWSLAATLLYSCPHQPVAMAALCRARRANFAVMSSRKPGVAEPSAIAEFVRAAADKLIVVDARNPDFSVEPGDEATNQKAPLATLGSLDRPRAVNVPYDRESKSMDLSKIPKEWIEAGGGPEAVPIITHCGGGGRGQKAKVFLEANGFKNVINGGGPEDEECWCQFGDK